MAAAFAIARPVQCVVSCGGSAQVSATTRATVSAEIGGLPGLRVLSRSSPSVPSSAKRPDHRTADTQQRCHALHWITARPTRALPAPGQYVFAAGCDPRRSPQVAPYPTRSQSRRPSVPCEENRTALTICESAEWVRELAVDLSEAELNDMGWMLHEFPDTGTVYVPKTGPRRGRSQAHRAQPAHIGF
jgi:hypothetical protein